MHVLFIPNYAQDLRKFCNLWKHRVDCVVNIGKGNLFRIKDGKYRKYLIYLPLSMATDSQFPFKTETSVRVKVSFKIGEKKLIIEPIEEKP